MVHQMVGEVRPARLQFSTAPEWTVNDGVGYLRYRRDLLDAMHNSTTVASQRQTRLAVRRGALASILFAIARPSDAKAAARDAV